MKKLERRLGLGPVVAISISAMLGSGIFVLPSIAFEQTGASVYLAYLLAAICVLPASISKSELATAMPTSGGTYVYLERTFGPFIGTVAGLGLWLSLLLKCAFALVGFGAYLSILAEVPLKMTALALLCFITILNIFGVGKVSGILMVVVCTSLITLLILATGGLFQMEMSNFQPLLLNGTDGFFAATALVFVSYAGVTKVAAIAEEIKSPEKNLPRGILLSLITVTCIYTFVTFILAGNFEAKVFFGNYHPIYTLALKVAGPVVATVIAGIAILTMTSMANAGILAASRFPFAMSRDRLLPAYVGRLHKKFLTPLWSIIFSSIVVGATILTMDVAKIAKFASAFMLLIYVFENIAVIVLREGRVQWYKPAYKSPLYPFLQIFGIATGVALLFAMGKLVISAVLTIAVPGLLLYFVYAKKRTDRKGVLGIRGRRKDLVDDIGASFYSDVESMDLSKDAKVVCALFGNERSPEMLIELGTALADGGNLEVAHLTEVPEQTDLNDMFEDSADLKSLRRRVIAMSVEQNLPITFDPVATHDINKTVFDISQRLHCQWLLKEWGGKRRGTFTFHNPVGWLKRHLQCHLAVFRDSGVRYIRKIMIIVKHDENDALVLETADHLANINKAAVTLIKWYPSKTDQEVIDSDKRDFNKMTQNITSRSAFRPIVGNDKLEHLISASAEYDLLVFGASEHSYWQDLWGSEDDRLISGAACSVVCMQAAKNIIS